METETVAFACMEKYHEAKTVTPDAVATQMWSDGVREKISNMQRRLRSAGWQPANPNMSDVVQFEKVLRLCLGTEGTAGALRDLFKRMNGVTLNLYKRDVREALDSNPRLVASLHKSYLAFVARAVVADYSGHHITVHLKQEPIKWKKVLQGNYRTIMSPCLEITLLDMAATCWTRDGEVFLSQDSVLTRYASVCNHEGATVCMSDDTLDTLYLKNYGPFACIDVVGWERSLPLCVIESLYESVYAEGFKHLAAFNARGTHGGFGTYVINGGHYRLLIPITMWASGVLMTLFGNTMIHAGLPCAWKRAIKGDDAIHQCDPSTIASHYLKFGLVVHEPESGFDFVGLTPQFPYYNLAKWVGKASARRGGMTDALTEGFAHCVARVALGVRQNKYYKSF